MPVVICAHCQKPETGSRRLNRFCGFCDRDTHRACLNECPDWKEAKIGPRPAVDKVLEAVKAVEAGHKVLEAVKAVDRAYAFQERCAEVCVQAKTHSRTFLRKKWDAARSDALHGEFKANDGLRVAGRQLNDAVSALVAAYRAQEGC